MNQKWWTSVLLVLSVLMSLVACNGKVGEKNPSGPDTEFSEPETLLTLFDGSENDYPIIYSATATDRVSDAVMQLKRSVSDRVGKTPVVAPDNSKKQIESDREIIIGLTTRAESESELEKIDGYGWRIAFVGKKLVVSATNDLLLAEAVDRLMGTWISEGTTVSLSNHTRLTHDASDEVLPLAREGAEPYRVIIPKKTSDDLYKMASKIATVLGKASGQTVSVAVDSETAEADNVYEICLGNTTREASTRLYAELKGMFEGRCSVDGTRIVLGGMTEDVLLSVAGSFYNDLNSALSGTYRGGVVLPLDYSVTTNSDTAAAYLPAVNVGKLQGTFNTGKEAYVLYTTGVTELDYISYLKTLRADGCAEEKTYTLADNRYSLMKHEKYTAYVSYLPAKNAMRVYVGKPDVEDPTVSEPITANVCEPTLWQLDVDNYGAKANGGMSYVIQLTDGSFLVVDGGYSTQTEAKNLYDHLVAHTPEGQKPVISAWFITHGHIDHYGALMTFSAKYADAVDVKAFYYNLPYITVGDIGANNSKSIEAAMTRWQNAKRYSALHSGMKIGLAGATVTVICTLEDVYPLSFVDGNDTSLMFRVDVGGQRIMFTGDAHTSESVTVTNTIDRTELKSDIVQFSHHGYPGCDRTFYSMVDAEVVLWPMNVVGYTSNGNTQKTFSKWYNDNSAANKFIREQVDKGKIKKIFCMGDGTVELKLPYTPEGRVLPDIDEIYERTARKS